MEKTALRTTNQLYIFIYKTNLVFLVSLLLPFALLVFFNVKIILKVKSNTVIRPGTIKNNKKIKTLQKQV
jgi:hypothetical protein